MLDMIDIVIHTRYSNNVNTKNNADFNAANKGT